MRVATYAERIITMHMITMIYILTLTFGFGPATRGRVPQPSGTDPQPPAQARRCDVARPECAGPQVRGVYR